jgi:hypothetical protein
MFELLKTFSISKDDVKDINGQGEQYIVELYKAPNGDFFLETKIHEGLWRVNVTQCGEGWIEWYAGVWARQINRAINHGMKRARDKIRTTYDIFVDTMNGRI